MRTQKLRGEVCVVEAFTNHPRRKRIVGFAVLSASQLRTYISSDWLRDLAIHETRETLKSQADLLADRDNACVIQSWKVWPWKKFSTTVELREDTLDEQSNADPMGGGERTAVR